VLSVIENYPLLRALVRGSIDARPGRRFALDFQSSDYDVAWVIPYDPLWDAKRIAVSIQVTVTSLSLISIYLNDVMLFFRIFN
jgi:hypothetical protein